MTSYLEKKKLFVLNSYQASSIATEGSTRSQVRRSLGEYDFVVGPVHLNENLWTLLKYWTRYCKSRTTDSLGKINWDILNDQHILQYNFDALLNGNDDIEW